MQDSTNPYVRAIAALSELFLETAYKSKNFGQLESDVIDLGHKCIASALGLALEALDSYLLQNKPDGLSCHDIRRRSLATEVGDVSFSLRRYRDRYGRDVYLLADTLDFPYGIRVSPGAAEFLVEAAAQVSYAKAARLLARHGSSVKPTSVMKCMRQAGALCAEQDEREALLPYRDGVVPDAEEVSHELCVEADGTYFRAQGLPIGSPKRFEVKAMCAYKGKEVESGKTKRKGCVHHALVGRPETLWSEGMASMGKKYDLSKIERVHLGSDGEKWCRDVERYLPKAQVTYHLDPFHVNHAIMGCFDDKRLAWNVIDVVSCGDKHEAIALLSACLDYGLAKQKRTRAVISYLEGNIDAIAVEGPSLGTMESENQHLYGARMDSFPCAWSLRGASDMARIISRRASSTSIPRMTRKRSEGLKRAQRRQEKELSYYGHKGKRARMVESVGQGYLPPHQVDTRRMGPGKAYALRKGMAILDGRI